MRLRVLLFALAAAVPGGDLRAALPCDLPLARRATVARVLDGETLRLDDGGEVRLLGILAPRPPAWLRKRDSWPPAEAARAALAGLASPRAPRSRSTVARRSATGAAAPWPR